jgi:uncharacterized protein YggT (Ycf19 family)
MKPGAAARRAAPKPPDTSLTLNLGEQSEQSPLCRRRNCRDRAEFGTVGGLSASILVADWVTSVQNFVEIFTLVYFLLIFAYILMSWIRLPYSIWLNRIQRFLYDVCEPYLRIFRRILPPFGPLDLSPIVGIFTLWIGSRVVISLLDRLH